MPVSAASPGDRRRHPLYIHLSVLFSALVLAAGSTIAWLGYIEQRDTALADAGKLFAPHRPRGARAMSEALQPVRRFAEILAQDPIVRARSLDARLRGAAPDGPRVRRRSAGRGGLRGYDDGSFFLLRPLRDASERSAFAAPEGAAYLVQSVEVGADGERQAAFIFFDASLRELGAPRLGRSRSTRATGPGIASPPSRANACSPTPTSSPRPVRRA